MNTAFINGFFALLPLLVLLLVILGIAVIVGRSVAPQKKRVVKVVAAVAAVVPTVLYIGFLWLIAVTYLDTQNLLSPEPETKLAQWSQTCDKLLADFASRRDLDQYLRSLDFYNNAESKKPWEGQSHYRYSGKGDSVYYSVSDKDVLNWGSGDVDIQTTILVEKDVVTRCQPRISKHGR